MAHILSNNRPYKTNIMTYKEILSGIRKLEIQGAQNIAVKGVEAFGMKLKETDKEKKLQKYMKEIIKTRPTEPALRNALKYCLANRENNKKVAKQAIKYFKESKKRIAEIGAKKIKNGMTVFTHCHSSTVTAILLKAKKEKKKFQVFNTETRPKYQGRITAKKLLKAGIPVTHMVDSCGRSMMRKCDLFLFGCDAITSEGFLINKIGTEALVDAAHESRIPAYSCTSSWKFDPETITGMTEEIEQRNPKEVWERPPKKIKIFNPAFEISLPDKFTGVISEIGIFKPEALVIEIQKAYPYLIEHA